MIIWKKHGDMLSDNITVNTLDDSGYPPLYAVIFGYYDDFIAYNWFPPYFGVYHDGPDQYAPGPYPHEERVLNSVYFLLNSGANPTFEVENTIGNSGNTALKVVYQLIQQYINALIVGEQPENTVIFNLQQQDDNPTIKEVYQNGLDTFILIASILIDRGALGDNYDMAIHDAAITEAGDDVDPNNPVWIGLREYINDIRNETSQQRRERRDAISNVLSIGTMHVPGFLYINQRPAILDARDKERFGELSSVPPEIARLISEYETGEDLEQQFNYRMDPYSSGKNPKKINVPEIEDTGSDVDEGDGAGEGLPHPPVTSRRVSKKIQKKRLAARVAGIQASEERRQHEAIRRRELNVSIPPPEDSEEDVVRKQPSARSELLTVERQIRELNRRMSDLTDGVWEQYDDSVTDASPEVWSRYLSHEREEDIRLRRATMATTLRERRPLGDPKDDLSAREAEQREKSRLELLATDPEQLKLLRRHEHAEEKPRILLKITKKTQK